MHTQFWVVVIQTNKCPVTRLGDDNLLTCAVLKFILSASRMMDGCVIDRY